MYLKEGNQIAPGIMVYENVISNSEEVINLFFSRKDDWQIGFLGGYEQYSVRNGVDVLAVGPYFSDELEWFSVAKTIWSYADAYGKYFDVRFSEMDTLQVLRYTKGSGFCQMHSDYGPGNGRLFSAVLYLNTIDEGGEIYFNHFNLKIKPTTGSLVIFPSNFIYSHEAQIPVSDDKFAITAFFK